ncbi:MAG: PAS domain-containing sensor histidine kinase, partial [Pseudorhodoplanes sp.]
MTADKIVSAEALSGQPQGTRALARWLGPIAVGIALFSALLTFVVLTGLTRIVPTHKTVVGFLLANAIAALFLVAVIGREVWMIIQARRRGRAAAQLHVSVVGLFSVIAAVPAILVAIVASITLDRGLDRIFNVRTRAVIENSLAVAEAYMREHAQMIRSDIITISTDIARAKPLFDQDRDRFRQFLTAQASLRGLPAAVMIDKNLEVIERSNVRTSV